MKLSELLANIPGINTEHNDIPDVEISGVRTDSRKTRRGDLFVALDGVRAKGADFVSAAFAAGAAAALVPATSGLAPEGKIITAADINAAVAAITSRFFGNPSAKMQVIGVTGTNGKTTFTYLMEAISSRVKKTGVIGTINYRYGGKIFPAPNTTPFAGDLAELLANMKSCGVKIVAMEVSSHSLSQRRVDGVEFDCAVFTNLTQDHLDYHGDMQSYFEAKKRLFADLMAKSPKKNKTCVVNIDDEWGSKLARSISSIEGGARIVTCSAQGSADARMSDLRMSPRGAAFTCEISGLKHKFETQLIGRYNTSNAFLAAVAALSCGFSASDVKKGISSLKRIPGRMETIHARKGFTVVIDYAHTPDALSKVIGTLRDLKPGRLITVFGCGGDRDRTKRPMMGAVAAEGSDLVVATSDNPRTEDPHKIILDIEIGIKKTGALNYSIIMDRKEAIGYAIGAARPRDIVLLAGKGHETCQIIGEEKIPFSDYDVAVEAIKNRS